MNRVGVEGRGESVWLAWFLITTLRAFAMQADARQDTAVAAQLRAQADTYAAAVEAHAWDGAWYRRAYFDDGTPLGSSASDECRIDAIARAGRTTGAGAPKGKRRRCIVRENPSERMHGYSCSSRRHSTRRARPGI
jgi:cyclic beta-1,2-glucan synthetase